MSKDQPEPRGHYVDREPDAVADTERGHYYKKGEATESPDTEVGHYTDQQLPDGTVDEGAEEGPGHYVDVDVDGAPQAGTDGHRGTADEA